MDLLRLGRRVREERRRRGLSLAAGAARSGVSRSMWPDVERGAKPPTVLILDRMATALDTSMTRLLGQERPDRVVILPREAQGGDSAFHTGDCVHAFAKPGRGNCVYYLALDLSGPAPGHRRAGRRGSR